MLNDRKIKNSGSEVKSDLLTSCLTLGCYLTVEPQFLIHRMRMLSRIIGKLGPSEIMNAKHLELEY